MLESEEMILFKLCYARGFAAAIFVVVLIAAACYAVYLRTMCESLSERLDDLDRRVTEYEEKMQRAKEAEANGQ